MREIIYRDDCDLNAPSLGLDEMIHDTMVEYDLTWNTNPENDFDEDKIFEFAHELIQKAQNVIDTAPTVGYIKEVLDAGLYTKDGEKIMDLTKEAREELIGKEIIINKKEQRC